MKKHSKKRREQEDRKVQHLISLWKVIIFSL